MKFERGAQLAFRIDVELGFRAQPELDWTLRPCDELPLRRSSGVRKQAVSVEDIVDARYRAPETWIEAVEAGLVRITSTARLVVQEQGDSVPRQEGTTVEVPYGSVVRAGPVLLAPLDRDQSAALSAGTLDLPILGEGQHDEERISLFDGEVQRARRTLARRRVVVLFATLTVIAAAIIAGVYAWQYIAASRTRPYRVAIELGGLTRSKHNEFEEALRQRLEAYGFEPLFSLGRERSALLESAGQTLFLGVTEEPSSRVRGLQKSPYLFRVTAEIVDDESSSSHIISIATSEGDDMDDALALVREDILDATMPWAVTSLSERVTLDELDGDRSTRSKNQRRRFKQTWQWAKNYRWAERNEERRCSAPNDDSPDDGSFEQITKRCRWERLIGVVPSGKALVINETQASYFTLGEPPQRRFVATPHHIEVVDLETKARNTLASTSAYEPTAGLSRDGAWAFVLEVGDEQSALVAIEVASGEQYPLMQLARSSTGLVEPSPRGRYVAYTLFDYGRPSCYAAHHHLGDQGYSKAMIVDRMTKSSVRVALDHPHHLYWLDRVELEGEVYEPALIVTSAVSQGEHRRIEGYEGIALVDPRTGEVLRRIHREHWRMVEIAGAADGEIFISICADNYDSCRAMIRGYEPLYSPPAPCILGRLNFDSTEVREERLERCLGQRPILIGRSILSDDTVLRAFDLESKVFRQVSTLQRYVNLNLAPDGSAYFTRTREPDVEGPMPTSSGVPGIYRLDLGALQRAR